MIVSIFGLASIQCRPEFMAVSYNLNFLTIYLGIHLLPILHMGPPCGCEWRPTPPPCNIRYGEQRSADSGTRSNTSADFYFQLLSVAASSRIWIFFQFVAVAAKWRPVVCATKRWQRKYVLWRWHTLACSHDESGKGVQRTCIRCRRKNYVTTGVTSHYDYVANMNRPA
jgi:hypothetical protein